MRAVCRRSFLTRAAKRCTTGTRNTARGDEDGTILANAYRMTRLHAYDDGASSKVIRRDSNRLGLICVSHCAASNPITSPAAVADLDSSRFLLTARTEAMARLPTRMAALGGSNWLPPVLAAFGAFAASPIIIIHFCSAGSRLSRVSRASPSVDGRVSCGEGAHQHQSSMDRDPRSSRLLWLTLLYSSGSTADFALACSRFAALSRASTGSTIPCDLNCENPAHHPKTCAHASFMNSSRSAYHHQDMKAASLLPLLLQVSGAHTHSLAEQRKGRVTSKRILNKCLRRVGKVCKELSLLHR